SPSRYSPWPPNIARALARPAGRISSSRCAMKSGVLAMRPILRRLTALPERLQSQPLPDGGGERRGIERVEMQARHPVLDQARAQVGDDVEPECATRGWVV